jgi:ADP-ribosylation factor related protein 1
LEKIKSIFSGTPGLPPDKITPTVGLNSWSSFHTPSKVKLKPCRFLLPVGKIALTNGRSRLNFWDLGGQRDLRTLWEKYYEESHGVMFVIDSGDPERIEECRVAFGGFHGLIYH